MTDKAKSLVRPIADAIKELEDRAADLALEGQWVQSDHLMAEVEDLRERQEIGELYYIGL